MTHLPHAPIPSAPGAHAHPQAVVQGPGYRISVLTSRLLRIEHSATDSFTDERTQLVLCRALDLPEFTVDETDDLLEVRTSDLHLRYDKRAFSPAGLSVTMRRRAQGSHHTTWHYGDPVQPSNGRVANLGGTARTLDDVDGPTPLDPGLLSLHGFAIVDDSNTLVMTDDEWVAPRAGAEQDLYFFGYGLDYQAALADFFRLTGPSPLIPRWTLGNWWSRFHRYTADEYLGLMDRFRAAGIPFSVSVVDMDWHLTDIDPSLGSGWTGYTWNRELFPDPQAFLDQLHERNLRVSLNVHPADGVRRHEDAYEAMARELGIDPAVGAEIAFDISSREFVAAYLTHLHHPLEAEGVDFWWLDWQSGGASRTPGLDPLWMLNHVHYLDSGRDGARPLTFSRYAGLGSHRYPVGFSGDTVTTWDSLAFQPYFTATAANAGYFWWSHDIGGHLGGTKDNELATRWFQFGVFSPINRLHSSMSPFNGKEPWRFGNEAARVMTSYLRLRHQLVPYLYTAMWDAHTGAVGPVRPMYHDHPQSPEAYDVPNQYMFGPDLLVAPVTTPADRRTHHAEVGAWLPPGAWYDVFDGLRYDGGRRLDLHRTLENIPVLARAGAILPLAADPMADTAASPEELVLRVFAGADGRCALREDDGSAAPASTQETVIGLRWAPRADGSRMADATLAIAPPTGDGVLTTRTLRLELVGAVDVAEAAVTAGGVRTALSVVAQQGRTPVLVDLGTLDLSAGATLELTGVTEAGNDLEDRVFTVLDAAEIAYDLKATVLQAVRQSSGAALLAALHSLDLPGNLFGVLAELVSASASR
ncbi:glycoside hydrolase family 31 protein [Cellulomonas timonensis]|uniref:glycoside hydrolase family 31 protein n=1 Tax=Cellulomonas timonensis TaxID=1689271 RepID=UPI000835C2CE|nr:glycoside hydrolase family 31 protein [Cellulomonas timonensis]